MMNYLDVCIDFVGCHKHVIWSMITNCSPHHEKLITLFLLMHTVIYLYTGMIKHIDLHVHCRSVLALFSLDRIVLLINVLTYVKRIFFRSQHQTTEAK